VLKRLDLTIWPTKLLLTAANSFPLISFSVAVLVWFHRHAHADDRELYVQALAMVFLFGWMVDFVLFSGMTEHLYMFLIVLNEIIVQDIILSFILVFVCTVVGFSFALRLKAELSEDALVHTTVYDVLVSALGGGSFFEETREQLNDRMGLFRVVFAFYICFTAILLLNVLVAMVNNRYAEEVWTGSKSSRPPTCCTISTSSPCSCRQYPPSASTCCVRGTSGTCTRTPSSLEECSSTSD